MKGYTTHCYKIQALTNLHVGSGDTHYGVIDKMVQRDAITKYPSIHSSSLKGALREYFTHGFKADGKLINHIFGSERSGKETENPVFQKGEYRFFDAHLLALPVRSNTKPYYLVSSKEALEQANAQIKLFDCKNSTTNLGYTPLYKATSTQNVQQIRLENLEFLLQRLPVTSTDLIVVPHDNYFDQFIEDLPVLARNQLENGESKNLWYEEIVPRESVFYFFIAVPEKDTHFDNFNKDLNEQIIQIGGNASIGYGFCKITQL